MENDPFVAANARLDEEAALLQRENDELRQILARKRALVERLRVLVPEVERRYLIEHLRRTTL